MYPETLKTSQLNGNVHSETARLGIKQKPMIEYSWNTCMVLLT